MLFWIACWVRMIAQLLSDWWRFQSAREKDVIVLKFEDESKADQFESDVLNLQEGRRKRPCRCGQCMASAKKRKVAEKTCSAGVDGCTCLVD